MPTENKAKRSFEPLPIGQTFGLWTVIGHIHKRTQKALCRCQCGTERIILKYDLLVGKTTSCGCNKAKKTRTTCLNKYGCVIPQQHPDVKERAKQTCLERYGVEYSGQSEQKQRKTKQTFLEKYGVENPYQAEEIKDKIKAKLVDLYGSDNPSKVKKFQEKRTQTIRKKYGSDNYFQSQEWRDFLATSGSTLFTSKGEAELLEFVRQIFPNAKKIRKNGIEIDIYIHELKIGIEYNGLYWHSEACKPKKYHLDKHLWCKENDITLIQVFSHEWKMRQTQIKSRIRSIFGQNNKRVGARVCKIVTVDKVTASEFLEHNHIQGKCQLSHAFGLKFNDRLVALATFAKHHRNSSQVVLNRFCCLQDWSIAGGLSRLSKHASKILQTDIITWCDRRWSDGGGFLRAGWTQSETLKPDYFYFNRNNKKVISKQSRQKKKIGTPASMTEHEHALRDKLLRVYDCGKIRFIYKYSRADNDCDM